MGSGGAWPWWSLKLPQSGPISLETKDGGGQQEGLAPASACCYGVGGRVPGSPYLSSTSKGEKS